jgi:hypothetical protein
VLVTGGSPEGPFAATHDDGQRDVGHLLAGAVLGVQVISLLRLAQLLAVRR